MQKDWIVTDSKILCIGFWETNPPSIWIVFVYGVWITTICYTIRQWIHAAVVRKVKLLDLMFFPPHVSDLIELPHSLVTCGSLEVLKLCLFRCILCVPNITTGFQALRVLELKEVDLYQNNLLNYFLESCPLLEDLSLIDYEPPEELVISSSKLKNLRIDARKVVIDEDDGDDRALCFLLEITCPKLEFLKLTGYVAMEILFQNLYSLKKAVIHPENLCTTEAPSFDMFARMSHVESLSIFVCCIEQWFHPEVNAPISLLPSLKTLEVIVDVYPNMDALLSFLKCLPDLESLHLIIPEDIFNVNMWNLDEAATINVLTQHLKKVEFLEFAEKNSTLVVARALLEHGNVLEEMVFSWGDEAKFHERSMEVLNEVSKFHKTSSTAKLTAVINPT